MVLRLTQSFPRQRKYFLLNSRTVFFCSVLFIKVTLSLSKLPSPLSPPEPYQYSLLLFSDLLHHRLWIGAFLFHGPFAALLGCSAAPRGALLPCAEGGVPEEAPSAPWSACWLAGVLELAQDGRAAQAVQPVPCCREEPVSTG